MPPGREFFLEFLQFLLMLYKASIGGTRFLITALPHCKEVKGSIKDSAVVRQDTTVTNIILWVCDTR